MAKSRGEVPTAAGWLPGLTSAPIQRSSLVRSKEPRNCTQSRREKIQNTPSEARSSLQLLDHDVSASVRFSSAAPQGLGGVAEAGPGEETSTMGLGHFVILGHEKPPEAVQVVSEGR